MLLPKFPVIMKMKLINFTDKGGYMLHSKRLIPLIYLASACIFLPLGSQVKANELNWQTSQINNVTIAQRMRRLRFRLPTRGIPGARIGGATRAGSKKVTAIIPQEKLALTASNSPTIFVYLPKHQADDALLTISNEQGETVYTSSFVPPQESGLLRIKLPESVTLENEQTYKWEVRLDPQSSNPMTGLKFKTVGWMEKVAVDNNDQNQESWEQLNTLAEAGVWYETLDTLADMKLENPNDETIQAEWSQLLESVGLEDFTETQIISQVIEIN